MAKAKGFTHDSVDNISVDWYTPKWIFDELAINFDLDPCQPNGGISWIPSKKYYSLPDNGLLLPWTGNIWLNPPYGTETKNWLHKMHNHRNGVALVFARTDTTWFHDYVINADAILFIKKRIQFVDGLGLTGKSGAGAGSMLISWGSYNTEKLKNMANNGFGFFVECTKQINIIDGYL